MAETIGALVLGAAGFDVGVGLLIFGLSSTAVAGAVGGVVLLGASIGLQILLRPKAPGQAREGDPALPAPEAGHQPIKQAIPPRIVGYGRVRLAGAYVLYEAQDGVSYDVVALHHGRIGGFVGYYLHDDVVTLGGTGIVDEQGDGRYGTNAVTIKTRLGLSTETAYSEITTPLSAIWTSGHRGDGLASLAMICNQLATPSTFANTFPRGKPEPSVVADCTPIFDPRDVTQSRGNTSTWLVSSNPVLQLIDFLTNSDRGFGFDYDTLITPSLTALMAQTTICDQPVTRVDGSTEPRYASNGSFPLDSDPADVVSSILDTCDGWISQNGDGSLAVFIGSYVTPTIELESAHIRGCSLQYDLADEEAVNELTIDYTDPLLDYKTVPGQPWRNETDISERGKVRSQRLALPWVYSHPQARRLAKRRDNQNNATLRGTLTTTLYGIRCLGERWVQITAPDLPDLENVVIEIRAMTIDLLNATCQIKFVSVNPNIIDAWDAATEEGSSPSIPDKLISIPPPIPQNIANVVTPTDYGHPPTSPYTFGISCDDPGRSDLRYQTAWRVNGSGGAFTADPIQASNTTLTGRPFIFGGVGTTVGIAYEIKMRSLAPTGPASSYSSTIVVTAHT